MTPPVDHAIDIEGVEALLEFHLASKNEETCPEIEFLARLLTGETDSVIEAAANAHLAECEWCRGAFIAIGRLTATGVLGPLPGADTAVTRDVKNETRRILRSRRYGLLAATFVLVLFGALLVSRFAVYETASTETALVVKGVSDKLHVAVMRGMYRFTLQSGEKLHVGDDIGFFYSAKKSGYLTVFGVDTHHKVTLIFPIKGEHGGVLPPGERTQLPAGGVINAGTGCEWLIGVFSDKPLDITMMTEKIAHAVIDKNRCHLKVDIDGARSVQIISYLL